MNYYGSIKQNKTKIIYLSAFAALLYIVYRYRIDLGGAVKPFIIAAVISYLLNPIVERFEKKGFRRIVAVLFVYLIFLFIILGLSFGLAPKLVKEIGILIENMPEYSEQVQSIIKRFQDGYINSRLPESLKDILDENIILLQSVILTVLQNIASGIIDIFSQIFYIVIVPVITFYLLKDKDYFKTQLIMLLPKSKRKKYLLLFRDIDNVFGRYIRGQIIVASFVGVFTTFALVIIKVKYAVVLGIFAGISNIIPYFGPFIGIIPTILFALLDSPAKAMYAAGAFILIQQVESGFLTPKIIGKSVGIHPVYVILSLIVGGKFFGVLGLIIAVPVLAAIKLTMRHLLREAE